MSDREFRHGPGKGLGSSGPKFLEGGDPEGPVSEKEGRSGEAEGADGRDGDREISAARDRSDSGSYNEGEAEERHDRTRKEGGSSGSGGSIGGRDHLPTPSTARARYLAPASETTPELYGRDLFGATSASQDDDLALDYRKYIGIIIKHRWLIAGIAAISLSLGLFYTILQTPIYRASATIQIKREVANISGIAGLEPVEVGRSNEFYQTQYELLKSRALAERVVSTLHLAGDPAVYETRPSGWSRLRELVFPRGDAQAPNITARQAMAVGAVLNGLSVEPVRASSIVRINFDSAEPRIAQRVANALAENFITSNLERNFEASAYARKFLEERLQELRLKLEESERGLVAYAEKQDILTTDSDQSLSMVNLADANAALAAVAKERLRHEMRWRQAEVATGDGVPQSLETEAIHDLRARQTELALTYENKLKVFKPGFPEMLRLQAQLDEIDRQIKAEVDRIRDSLRLQYEASLKEEQTLLRRVDELKSEVMDYQNRNIQYTILQREVDTNRSLYEGLLQRYKEIGVAGGIDSSNATNSVSFVDRAQVPSSPYKPRLSRNLAAALFFGLMLGGAAAFAREFFDNSYRSPEELEEALGLPLLGVIPFSNEVADLEKIINGQRSSPAEAYRSLRTALQFSTATGTPRSLVVTSALPGEGKSTAALNLAGQFAKLGLRVLLIDADLRKPSLHRLLGRDGSAGLTNYLVGSSAPPEAFQATTLPNLTLMPCGPIPPNPAELLAGPRMASLLAAATEEFDLVIIDAPPVAGLADAPLLASMSLGTLLVVEANKTHRRAVVTGLKRLQFARADVVGVVFNKFDPKQAGYAYGYGYGYGDESYYGYGSGEQKRLADTSVV